MSRDSFVPASWDELLVIFGFPGLSCALLVSPGLFWYLLVYVWIPLATLSCDVFIYIYYIYIFFFYNIYISSSVYYIHIFLYICIYSRIHFGSRNSLQECMLSWSFRVFGAFALLLLCNPFLLLRTYDF